MQAAGLGIKPLEDKIRYQHMYVREIDLLVVGLDLWFVLCLTSEDK